MGIERHFIRAGLVVAGLIGSGACSSSQPPSSDDGDEFTYVYTTYLTGLEENARIVKTLRTVRVYLDDGRVVSEPQMQVLDGDARRAKFGAMDPGFAKYVRSQAPGAMLKVAFMFAIDDVSPRSGGPRVGTPDQIRIATLKQSIARAYGKVEPFLRANGVQIETTVETMPVVLAEASAAVIDKVSKSPLITLAVTAETRPGRLHVGGQPGDGVVDPHIDTTFNAQGHYAAGQRIGIVEDNYSGLFDNHEAFSQAEIDPSNGYRVTYQREPQDCTSTTDCTASGQGFAQDCINLGHTGHTKQCVSAHASAVASVATGTNGGNPYGAARARYYYPNGDATQAPGPHNACSPTDLLNAYNWLAGQGVTVVDESWGCQNSGYNNGTTLEGITQDWYARHSNMAIFKSAGNKVGPDGQFCSDPNQPACPYSLNSTCVGANEIGGGNANDQMTPYSSFTNNNGPDGTRTDREEPDVSMLGGSAVDTPLCPDYSGLPQVDVLNGFNGITNEWTTLFGTSFAAPAAAAMAALCQEVLDPAYFQSPQREQTIRAILKSAGWERNIINYHYSTSFTQMTNPDWLDGGGTPMGDAVWAVCNRVPGPGGTTGLYGTDPGDQNGGLPFNFGGACRACNNPRSPLYQSTASGTHFESSPPPSSGDNRHYHQFAGPFSLTAGTRIRAVVVWDSCPNAPGGIAPAPVKTDIDLFLVRNGFMLASSQSVSDVTEGFDIAVPYDGSYTLWWAAVPGPGCDGTAHEPLAWSVWYGGW